MRAFSRLFLFTFFFSAIGLLAQSSTSVSGVVVDPSGAVMPKTALTLTNIATGAERQTDSDSSGRYTFLQLQPGTYSITAKAKGFSDVIVNNLVLLVNSPSTVDIHFEHVGSMAQSVSVTASTTQINTTDASIGNAIGAHAISQLPLEARNVVGLLALQPGVTFLGDVEPDQENDYRSGAVNGGKNDQGNVTLDGIDVNNQQSRDAFTSVLRITPDSVEEFRTTTTNGGADVGRTSGAQVAIITKSGTNQFHGSLYDYFRNTATSANDFFSNADGVPRAKLNRNLFGGTLGGPIKKDRLFFFVNYEGRQDRSETPTVRTVPNATFRQGYFNYLTNSGTVATLTPAQVAQIDPLHKGPDPAVLLLFQSYPLPNDNTVGDNLNTAGYRFNAPEQFHMNDYIAKFDYKIDSAGKHTIFWRGSMQDDHLYDGAPQFPGDPPSSAYLDHSKGIAIGYTALLRPDLVSTFHYGLTREGLNITGVQTAGAVSLSGIDDRHALTDGLIVIIPTHMLSEDLSWNKGAHTVTFGADVRIIRNRRDNFLNSFSAAFGNYAFLSDGGKSLLAPGAANTTDYAAQFSNLLGLITEIDAQYNYDLKGNVLPEGTGIKRTFAEQGYDMYLQDSWKITRAFTLTAGVHLELMPPVYEANGYQVSPNVPLGDWFNQRAGLVAAGLPQSQAPTISYNLSSAPGGRPLYSFKTDWEPRFAMAYSPQGDSGLSKFFFGGPGKSAIRAGWGMYYDLFGQGIMRSYDSSALGFETSLENLPNLTPSNAPRFTGIYDLPRSSPFFPQAPPGGFPQTEPADSFAITNGLDSTIKAPYTMNTAFSIQREFSHGFFIQAAYVDRESRRSLIADDVAAATNLVDPQSGMTYFQAATELEQLVNQNTPTQNVAAIPFWEDIFPGYANPRRGLTATQAIYNVYDSAPDATSALTSIDGPGCKPCSKFGPYALFNSQYSSLAVLRSIGSGSYHAMQWTVRKQFSEGVELDFNYTYSKSIDLGSFGETQADPTLGQILNPWNASQMRAVSDYDAQQLVSADFVAELPFGHSKRFFAGANRFVNGLIGGWQVSGIWRQSTGMPASVGNGSFWPTNWNLSGYATPVGRVPAPRTTKNAPAVVGTGGPNMFADPAAALAAYGFTLPGQSGQRNGLRGDGYFTIDLGLAKRFNLFTVHDRVHSLQIRAESFNVTNSVRFDPQSANLSLGDPNNFGKYTYSLTTPRVFQFSARYEF